MEAIIIDAYLSPILVPSIMGLNTYRRSSLIYTTVAAGTIISAIYSALNLYLNRRVRSRWKLTLLTTLQVTVAAITAILSVHYIRLNFQPTNYELPLAIRGQTIKSSGDVLRHHLFADMIPGFVIFTQVQLCSFLHYILLHKAKRKFKYGEASIVAQLASAAYLTWALTTYCRLTGAGPFQVNLTMDIVLQLGMTTFCLLILPTYLLLNGRSTILRYILLAACLYWSYTRAKNLIATTSTLDPLTWLVDHIFSTHQRISLFSLWLSTLTACISFSTSWTRVVGQTNSLVRKIFHLALGVVFISGYNQDIDFTRFAASGMLVILFILEVIRIWSLPPAGRHLEKVCASLRGGWDNKYMTLSHIYLLVGTFIPLWILPGGSESKRKLILSSGLISLGVGDTAAAIVGTLCGKTKLKASSNKTLEGLVANICAMIIFKLVWVGYTDFEAEYSFIIAAVLTSIVEVSTSACDNLILPLVMNLCIEVFCTCDAS